MTDTPADQDPPPDASTSADAAAATEPSVERAEAGDEAAPSAPEPKKKPTRKRSPGKAKAKTSGTAEPQPGSSEPSLDPSPTETQSSKRQADSAEGLPPPESDGDAAEESGVDLFGEPAAAPADEASTAGDGEPDAERAVDRSSLSDPGEAVPTQARAPMQGVAGATKDASPVGPSPTPSSQSAEPVDTHRSQTPAGTGEYRVLARKYRPKTFADMIGQGALVRTLSNAFATGRIAHAFVMTGVRGVGKTTTARIVARALNCIGPDGNGGPTITPCGRCEPCVAIAEDRHVDVMEMDAASRTGVGDIREIIEGVRYRPVSARYKVYIIDEVHMLSNSAFNALLKTLEEPPEHVKFIFATTEIRKLPVTVLSRCQRFDLRRVDAETLAGHFGQIARQEGATVDPAALRLIARAADGSVRDGLSLLDQAIALADGTVDEEQVRAMIGLADRSLVFDLLGKALTGDPGGALDMVGEMYAAGADPATVLQDLMELVHWLTRAKLAPDSSLEAEAAGLSDGERQRALELAAKLSMPALTRAWQLLLKGLQETRSAPMPLQAAEMVLIRLAYAADLPDPAALIRQLSDTSAMSEAPAPAGRGGGSLQPGGGVARSEETVPALRSMPAPARNGGSVTARLPQTEPHGDNGEVADRAASVEAEPPAPESFADVAALFTERREGILAGYLINFARLVAFEPGRIELRFDGDVPTDLTGRIARLLSDWSGRHWTLVLSDQQGAPTLREQQKAAEEASLATAERHPLVQAVLKTFPGAVIKSVKTDADLEAEVARSAPDASRPTDDGEADDSDSDGVGDDPDLDGA